MLSIQLLATFAGLLTGALSAALPAADEAGAVCKTYGVDFQDGGCYFINTNSNESFTFVSKFEGCQNDYASLMLVKKDTSDQWDCGQVPTVPDNTPQLATCQVQKNQLVSGEYLIIAIGNNGNGQPFSYQREFHIDAGPQQTVTAYPTKTVTTTPIETTTSISFINSTETVPNPSTTTQYKGTHTTTITPNPVQVTSTKTITHTFDRWTKSNRLTTVTVTPTCHVPPRPRHPDPVCRFKPKNVESRKTPYGFRLTLPVPPSDRYQGRSSGHVPREHDGPALHKRAPDNRTTTVSGPTSGEPTLTITAAPSKQTHVVVATTTYTVTAPPKTVCGGKAQQTVNLPASTKTSDRIVYTKQYATKTFGWTLTKTVVSIPSAQAVKCKREGGRFGGQW